MFIASGQGIGLGIHCSCVLPPALPLSAQSARGPASRHPYLDASARLSNHRGALSPASICARRSGDSDEALSQFAGVQGLPGLARVGT